MPKTLQTAGYPHSLAAALRSGAVGVFPTDTLYGLVGSALLPETIEKIYTLKGRDEHKPFIILISEPEDLLSFGVDIPPEVRPEIDRLWPGPVSIIFPCPKEKQGRLAYLHRGKNSLAFRLPADQALRAFLKESGPLVAPSANPQGEPPALTIAEAKNYFGDRIDFYLDHGEKNPPSSALLELDGKGFRVIRKPG